MRLKYDFTSARVQGKTVAVATGKDAGKFQGMLRLNESAAFMIEQLRKETDREALFRALLAEFEGDPEEIQKDMDAFLEELKSQDLLLA